MIPIRVEEYVVRVLTRLHVDDETKNRIRKDLTASILERAEQGGVEQALKSMGSPEEVAREFADNLSAGKDLELLSERINELTQEMKSLSPYYEYRSQRTLFGLPLVHIKIRRTGFGLYGRRGGLAVAKGIFAIGDVALGFLSLGIISAGFVSVGALSVGLAAFGAVAVGLALGVGAIAVGTVAIGAFAIGVVTIGAFAIGRLACGAYPVGHVTRQLSENELLTWSEFRDLLRLAFPKLFK
ncbi:HAAS signaling domain-containing protein [Gorillibacterium timonense]|uniref:HAAS signaling domain-containing protein n=1 Tax=Gorillibacterium timonense TaxID=1689269 RepID=UPI00071D07D6|nr:hypothetical protein [Gorillibacterium timonense]